MTEPVENVVPKKDSKSGLFEYKAVTEDGTSVVLRFKPYGDAPGRISRYNIGNMEAQIWAYLAWGLVEPANWPEDGKVSGDKVLDDLPQRDITKCYTEWRESDPSLED
jgi:hypothetical protein